MKKPSLYGQHVYLPYGYLYKHEPISEIMVYTWADRVLRDVMASLRLPYQADHKNPDLEPQSWWTKCVIAVE